MSRKRVSTGASVFAQAKSRAAWANQEPPSLDSDNSWLAPAPTNHEFRSRLDETPEPETGAARLRVIIMTGAKPEVYELTRLLSQPTFGRFLAEGFMYWALTVSSSSRAQNCRQLNFALSPFFATLKQDIAPEAIDEAYWVSLLAWLNGPRRRNGKPWSPDTRRRTLVTVNICISALIAHPEHGRLATALLERPGLPKNPWPNSAKMAVPTEVLSPSDRRAMILASLEQISAYKRRIDEQDQLLAQGRSINAEAQAVGCTPPYHSSIGACAARIEQAFPDKLPTLQDLRVLDRKLASAVQQKHGMVRVRQLLYASFLDLVPFVLLVAVKTAFNPETVLTLRWNQVKISDNRQSVTILGLKNRASGSQFSISDEISSGNFDFPSDMGEPFGLCQILDLLRAITRRTRNFKTLENQADYLFVGVPLWGKDKANTFSKSGVLTTNGAWRYSLLRFIENHKLKSFTLSMLRPTEGEIEWWHTGDLLAVRDRLGHKSVTTTRTHYTSDGMRRESQERVGETQALLARWAATDGRVDPRHQPEQCRSAATPGFGCLDPFHSPRPGQVNGKLCTAYGECPDCPLAQAWPRNVQAAAYYLALPNAIQEARLGRVSPYHWTEKWAPVLISLNRLLEEIPPSVRHAAAPFHIKLKSVG